jgi:hypothetical protein
VGERVIERCRLVLGRHAFLLPIYLPAPCPLAPSPPRRPQHLLGTSVAGTVALRLHATVPLFYKHIFGIFEGRILGGRFFGPGNVSAMFTLLLKHTRGVIFLRHREASHSQPITIGLSSCLFSSYVIYMCNVNINIIFNLNC